MSRSSLCYKLSTPYPSRFPVHPSQLTSLMAFCYHTPNPTRELIQDDVISTMKLLTVVNETPTLTRKAVRDGRGYLKRECDWLVNKIHFARDFAAVITDTASVAESVGTATGTTKLYRIVTVISVVWIPVIGLKE